MERVSEIFENTDSRRLFNQPAVSSTSPTSATIHRKPDALTLWKEVVESIRTQLNEKAFAAWIQPLRVVALNYSSNFYNGHAAVDDQSDAELVISAPNKFARDHVVAKYAAQIKQEFAIALGAKKVELSIRIEESAVSTIAKRADVRASTERRAVAAPSSETNLNPRSNFSNFVVGGCNQFAHAVSLQVAKNLGATYNPLFIYGGVGLGKTHLANAIGNAVSRRGKKALLVSSEAFVSEMIASLKSNNMAAFKNKFRSLDLLIVDDIQFIIGKERTEEEFFHTFNELHQRHKQIVITSDKVPQELVGLEDRLRTRLASGIAVDLQAPDFETRVAILSRKAEALGHQISDGVARLIATKIQSNVRELEGVLNKLVALAGLHNVKIDTELATDVLATLSPKSSRDITPELIQQTVSKHFNVSINDLTGKRRTQNIAHARQVAMYLCRKLTARSYPEIGAVFGGRDHSTVIHAKKVVVERMDATPPFMNEVLDLERIITGPHS